MDRLNAQKSIKFFQGLWHERCSLVCQDLLPDPDPQDDLEERVSNTLCRDVMQQHRFWISCGAIFRHQDKPVPLGTAVERPDEVHPYMVKGDLCKWQHCSDTQGMMGGLTLWQSWRDAQERLCSVVFSHRPCAQKSGGDEPPRSFTSRWLLGTNSWAHLPLPLPHLNKKKLWQWVWQY